MPIQIISIQRRVSVLLVLLTFNKVSIKSPLLDNQNHFSNIKKKNKFLGTEIIQRVEKV